MAGVFYNPDKPMPIGQIGYETGPISSPQPMARSSRQPAKRDLESEYREAFMAATKDSGGDPTKLAESLKTRGWGDKAVEYLDNYSKQRKQELDLEVAEVDQKAKFARMAGDFIRSGRKDLAIYAANKAIDDPEQAVEDITFNPKTNMVAYLHVNGQKTAGELDALIKADTNSETQFKEQAAYERLRLSQMKDPKTLSPTDLLGIALSKKIITEGRMEKEGTTAEEVYRNDPSLKLSPTELDLIIRQDAGTLGSVTAALVQVNPEMFDVWGKGDPAQFVVDLTARTQQLYRDELLKGKQPRAGGAGVPKPSESTRTTIEVAGKVHPAFTDKRGYVIMVDPSGKEGPVNPAKVENALRDGYKIK